MNLSFQQPVVSIDNRFCRIVNKKSPKNGQKIKKLTILSIINFLWKNFDSQMQKGLKQPVVSIEPKTSNLRGWFYSRELFKKRSKNQCFDFQRP